MNKHLKDFLDVGLAFIGATILMSLAILALVTVIELLRGVLF